jgi:hypothetical protein
MGRKIGDALRYRLTSPARQPKAGEHKMVLSWTVQWLLVIEAFDAITAAEWALSPNARSGPVRGASRCAERRTADRSPDQRSQPKSARVRSGRSPVCR